MTSESTSAPPLPIWWGIWAILIVQLIVLYVVLDELGTTGNAGEVVGTAELVPLLPLALSILMRWLALPLIKNGRMAFVAFVAGVSLGEACALTSLLGESALRNSFFFLGCLGIAQFVPFFARRYFE